MFNKNVVKMMAVMLLAILVVFQPVHVVAEESAMSTGDTIVFGLYEQDGNEQNGAEPIEWKVLAVEGSHALIISAKGLEAISYSEPMDVEAYMDKSLSWKTSYLREWLNDDFLNSAFSEEEKNTIRTSELNHNDASGKFTTEDKVFCLSIEEAEKYFANSMAMACSVSDYAKKGLKVDQGAITSDGYGCWWLRDMTSAAKPQQQSNFMTGTYNEVGGISGTHGVSLAKEGKGTPVFCDYLYTVRPAMWIDCTSNKVAVISAEDTSAPVYTTLEKGAKGEAVKSLQERLNALGYDLGTADGDFGNKTKAAIELFQKQNNLSITGVADAALQELLFSDKAKEAPITRKLNKSFSVNKKEITITSVSFVSRYDIGSMYANAQDTYLCVKLTLKNNTGKSLTSSTSDSLVFNTKWEGKNQYGTYFPAKERDYGALMWGLTDNYIASGKTVEMVYLIDVPSKAKTSGSLVLEFDDGSSYVVR